MVERFENKGEIFLWNKGNKVKFSSLGYIAKAMNTQTEFEVQENTSMIAGNVVVASASHRYWVYMNDSRCQKIWTVGVGI